MTTETPDVTAICNRMFMSPCLLGREEAPILALLVLVRASPRLILCRVGSPHTALALETLQLGTILTRLAHDFPFSKRFGLLHPEFGEAE